MVRNDPPDVKIWWNRSFQIPRGIPTALWIVANFLITWGPVYMPSLIFHTSSASSIFPASSVIWRFHPYHTSKTLNMLFLLLGPLPPLWTGLHLTVRLQLKFHFLLEVFFDIPQSMLNASHMFLQNILYFPMLPLNTLYCQCFFNCLVIF